MIICQLQCCYWHFHIIKDYWKLCISYVILSHKTSGSTLNVGSAVMNTKFTTAMMVQVTTGSYLVTYSHWVSWKLVINVYTNWIKGETYTPHQHSFEEITALLWNPEMRLSLNDEKLIHWHQHFNVNTSKIFQ